MAPDQSGWHRTTPDGSRPLRTTLDGSGPFLSQAEGRNILSPEYEERPLLAQSSSKKELTDHRAELALTTSDWKYMRRTDGGESLFNLNSDPFEMHDLAVLYPEMVEEFGDLAEQLQKTQKARSSGTTREATNEELDTLKGLGYGGDDED